MNRQREMTQNEPNRRCEDGLFDENLMVHNGSFLLIPNSNQIKYERYALKQALLTLAWRQSTLSVMVEFRLWMR